MILVRKLQNGDFDQFLNLMIGFYSYSGDGVATSEMIRPLFEKATDPNINFHVFVAADGTNLIGMISLTIGESSYKVSSFAWADDFYVDGATRGQGVGGKLMAAASDFAKDKGCSNVLVGVGFGEEETLKFYANKGFRDMQCKLLTLPLT